MGPRVYPSFQDTNTTAKGSLILSLSNTYINDIEITVNGLLRNVEYSNLSGFYTTNLNINDVVSILLKSIPTNYYKTINVLRKDYTTDDVAGDYGITDTSITNGAGYDTSGLTVTFTATTTNASYNFEYRISASIMAGTPTPTPTPSPTPTPPPFSVGAGVYLGILDMIIDESDNVYVAGGYYNAEGLPFNESSYITKYNVNGGIDINYRTDGALGTEDTSPPLFNKLLFTNDNKILGGGNFRGWFDYSPFPGPFIFSSDIIKMNKTSRTAYQAYPDSINTGATQNGFAGFGINDIVQQSDSKFIIGGNFGSYSGITSGDIVRINDNGTIDSSFNTGGVGFTTGEVKSIQLQSDGKIMVGGNFISYNGTTVYGIIRLNTNGTRDTSFTSYFTNDIEFLNAVVNTIQIQPDGKILLAGLFYSYNGIGRQSIVRLNTNGTIDTTFGSTSGFTGNYGVDFIGYGLVNDMILQSDGKILCAGDFTGYSGVSVNNIIRLNNDGTIDTSFNSGSGFNGIVYTMARQSTGNIMVGGSFTTYNGYGTFTSIARLSPDGGNNTYQIPATPTPTPTITPTPTVTPTPPPTDTPTPTPTVTPTPTPTPTPLPSIITSGLTAYYNYTPSSYLGTGTTWTNVGLSGSSYNATLVASPTFTYGAPGYFDFNGTSQYTTMPISGSSTGSFSISTWLQVPTGATSETYIMRNSAQGFSLTLGKRNNNTFEANVNAGSSRTIVGTTTINSSTWYNVTVRWTNGTGLSLWVNGIKESEQLTTDTPLRGTSSLQWNFMVGPSSNYAPGKLSNVAMYFRSLSDAEILSNFNTLKSIYGY